MSPTNPDVTFTQIFINNEWHDSIDGRTFETLNPATGQTIANVQEGTKADIDQAVIAARKAFNFGSIWRTSDASKRGDFLRRLGDLITRDLEYLARLISLDGGRLILEARNEVLKSVKVLKYYAGFADKFHGKTVPIDDDFTAYTRLEPIGVVGLICPWNAPVYLFCGGVGPALAAGNTVIVKPAEQTPLATLYLASLCKEAGIPDGVVNVVPGFGTIAGATLAQHPDVDHISFTGSRQVGRIIQMASAKSNLKRVTLELGGKSPLVISQNYKDLDKASKIAVAGCFLHSGQICCAATRTFVHESIHDAFVDSCVRQTLSRKLGDPLIEDTTQGPQIDGKQLEKILELIKSGINDGASLKCGGRRHGSRGFYIEPTVFADVRDDMQIAREEIFGPVMQILKYKTLEEVIERANDTEYGLAAAILTDNIDEAIQFCHSIRAGSVWANVWFGSGLCVPFGGYKQSGNGRSGGKEGIMEYLEVKTVSIKTPQKNS